MALLLYMRINATTVVCRWCGDPPSMHSDEEEAKCAKDYARLFDTEPKVDVPPPPEGAG